MPKVRKRLTRAAKVGSGCPPPPSTYALKEACGAYHAGNRIKLLVPGVTRTGTVLQVKAPGTLRVSLDPLD